MDTTSAPPLFLGGVEPGLGGPLEKPPLVLTALYDDGLLAGVEDRAVGGGGGEVVYLADEIGIAPIRSSSSPSITRVMTIRAMARLADNGAVGRPILPTRPTHH